MGYFWLMLLICAAIWVVFQKQHDEAYDAGAHAYREAVETYLRELAPAGMSSRAIAHADAIVALKPKTAGRAAANTGAADSGVTPASSDVLPLHGRSAARSPTKAVRRQPSGLPRTADDTAVQGIFYHGRGEV